MNESTAVLQACVDRYLQAMERLTAGLRPGDGILGFGNDPKRSPYHMDFYREVGQAAELLAGEGRGAQEAGEAVEFLLTMGQHQGDGLTRPMLEAAQGHARVLIPLLAPERAGELARQYAACYPRRRRLPVQSQVLAALEKRALGR